MVETLLVTNIVGFGIIPKCVMKYNWLLIMSWNASQANCKSRWSKTRCQTFSLCMLPFRTCWLSSCPWCQSLVRLSTPSEVWDGELVALPWWSSSDRRSQALWQEFRKHRLPCWQLSHREQSKQTKSEESKDLFGVKWRVRFRYVLTILIPVHKQHLNAFETAQRRTLTFGNR